jgi:hypothetical protein
VYDVEWRRDDVTRSRDCELKTTAGSAGCKLSLLDHRVKNMGSRSRSDDPATSLSF